MSSVGLALIQLLLSSNALISSANVYLPSIDWLPDNPLFQENKTLCVKLYDRISFFCPYLGRFAGVSQYSQVFSRMYGNLWIVDKRSFATCTVDTENPENKLLLQCNNPGKTNFIQIDFNTVISDPEKPRFNHGNSYHFISTSDGQQKFWNSTEGGYCRYNNMRITFYLYDMNVCEDCDDRSVAGKRLDYFACKPECTVNSANNKTISCRMNWEVDKDPEVKPTGFLWSPDSNHSVTLTKRSPQPVRVLCQKTATDFMVEYNGLEYCQSNQSAESNQIDDGKRIECTGAVQELISAEEKPDFRCYVLWSNNTGLFKAKSSLTVSYIDESESGSSAIGTNFFWLLLTAIVPLAAFY